MTNAAASVTKRERSIDDEEQSDGEPRGKEQRTQEQHNEREIADRRCSIQTSARVKKLLDRRVDEVTGDVYAKYRCDNERVEHHKNGMLHREDGAAIECDNGSYRWVYEGFLHRDSGPALCNLGSYEEWYLHGLRHRADGPAVVNQEYGTEEWWQNGQRHRMDGPAVFGLGRQEWRVNGELHRQDGPAIIGVFGGTRYYWRGKLHRESGPAVDSGFCKQWYIHGIQCVDDKEARVLLAFKKHLNNLRAKRFVRLCRSRAFNEHFYDTAQMGRKWEVARIEQWAQGLLE